MSDSKNAKLILPALRAQMGIWIYYVSTMSLEDVAAYVKPIDDELHKSTLLRDMIQRSITDNYQEISDYLLKQDERFFNALILAVYNGDPEWNEISVSSFNGLENTDEDSDYGLGVLSLSGSEKIFPVDGQHRVEGIKKALKSSDSLKKERVPVVFVGHSIDDKGMQRTRRLFSTLNRYAKPVSLRDIIALDEDDVVAIASRRLIDEAKLFGENRILDSKTKAIPDENVTAITSIIAYYECNKELLWLRIHDKTVIGVDEKKIKGRRKITAYLRHRPEVEMINTFTDDCTQFWTAIISHCKEAFVKSDVGKFRSKDGGHVFFRPVALIPFTKAYVRIKENNDNLTPDEIISSFPESVLWVQNPIWNKIIWNSVNKEMVMGNQKLTELIFIFAYDQSLLTDAEKKKIYNELRAHWDEVKDKANSEVFEELAKRI